MRYSDMRSGEPLWIRGIHEFCRVIFCMFLVILDAVVYYGTLLGISVFIAVVVLMYF